MIKKTIGAVLLTFAVMAMMLFPQGTVLAAESSNGSQLSDWKYTETDTDILLTRYIGESTDIVVPGVFDEKPGKKVFLGDNYGATGAVIFKPTATSIKIGDENTKVYAKPFIAQLFRELEVLTSLDLSGFDTSNATVMSSLFNRCSSLTTLDVSNLDISNATDIDGMFYRCYGLTTLDLSNFDTSKVTDMAEIFMDNSNLAEINLSNWDTSNVINMASVFSQCENLTILDVSTWNTSQVTDMRQLFRGCERLNLIDLSSWNTSKTDTGMGRDGMFEMDFTSPLYDQSPLSIVTKDANLKAEYDTSVPGRVYGGVKYDANGGTFSDNSTEKRYLNHFVFDNREDLYATKQMVSDKFVPTNGDIRFMGWYLDENCTVPFAADNTVIDLGIKEYMTDTTLYAGWENTSLEYTVKYDTDGGASIEDKTVGFNDSGLLPVKAPTKDGYTFKGWKQKDPASTNTFITPETTYGSLVSGNTVTGITLVAVWEINQYTVDYKFTSDKNPAGISIPKDVTVEYKATADEPKFVIPENWTFDGWYTDKELSQKYDFSTPITGSMTLYGKWTYKAPDTPKLEESAKPTKPTTLSTPGGTTDVPETGDATNLALFIALFGVSASSLFLLVGKKKGFLKK